MEITLLYSRSKQSSSIYTLGRFVLTCHFLSLFEFFEFLKVISFAQDKHTLFFSLSLFPLITVRVALLSGVTRFLTFFFFHFKLVLNYKSKQSGLE